jgi:hypothetical protein
VIVVAPAAGFAVQPALIVAIRPATAIAIPVAAWPKTRTAAVKPVIVVAVWVAIISLTAIVRW